MNFIQWLDGKKTLISAVVMAAGTIVQQLQASGVPIPPVVVQAVQYAGEFMFTIGMGHKAVKAWPTAAAALSSDSQTPGKT